MTTRDKITPEEMELIKKLQAHALENYNKGWDIFYECYTDLDILRDIHEHNEYLKKQGETIETFEEVLAFFQETMNIQNERRDEVQSFIF